MRWSFVEVGVASVLVVAVLAGCGGAGAGPLAWPKSGVPYWSGEPVKPGQFGVEAIRFFHAADQPAVLLSVRPQYPQEARGLTLRYAAAIGPGMSAELARGWPPPISKLRPLAGFVIPPHTRALVVIGAAAPAAGIYVLHGFTVEYRIGGTRYSAPQEEGIELCVGRRSCP